MIPSPLSDAAVPISFMFALLFSDNVILCSNRDIKIDKGKSLRLCEGPFMTISGALLKNLIVNLDTYYHDLEDLHC
jgi:hypothetical protein